jgi:hypothetical protein
MKTNIVRYKGQLGTTISDYNNSEIKKFLPMNYGRYYSQDLETIDENFLIETSFDEKLEFVEKVFPWGKVTKIHIVGEYQIIEYIRNSGERLFSPYINFNTISISYQTLDEALIGVISYKYDGANSQASFFITKMIGNEIHKDIKNYYEKN